MANGAYTVGQPQVYEYGGGGGGSLEGAAQTFFDVVGQTLQGQAAYNKFQMGQFQGAFSIVESSQQENTLS